ncbi:hypothetical protein, partial [Methylobacterium sp. WL116]|uniref:hypothetical protein n=1 Tax=Methylobacterium sp. WL116 TaxID=2603889 RepID=UPI0011CACF46
MIAESNRCRCDESRGQAAVEQALTRAFWHDLDGQGLSVMAALEAASRTIGVLYGQIAAAHGAGTTCTCGWVPDPDTDLIVLEAPARPPPARGTRRSGTDSIRRSSAAS